MSKLLKPRYEYYKGTPEVFDNKLYNFVDDVVYRLNAHDFYGRRLLKEKQNQDKQIIDLQYKLNVAEKALELACLEISRAMCPNKDWNLLKKDFANKYKQQAENGLKGK